MWRAEPECEPSSVGMDGGALDQMAERLHLAASEGLLFSGAQVAVFRDGRRVLDAGGGLARPRLDVPVAPDTMFVIFSSTKALTALAIHMLRERGALALDDRLSGVIPAFAAAGKDRVTVRHVLGHRGGFPQEPAWFTARWWGDRDAVLRALGEAELRWQPGEANGYHALTYGWALAELCLRADPEGRDLGSFLRDEVFAPLRLTDVYLGLPADDRLEGRVAWAEDPLVAPAGDAAGVAAYAPTAVGDRHRDTPELSIPWNRPAVHRLIEAAAGAIATARDHGRIYAALSLGGALDGVRLLDTGTLDEAITPSGSPGEVDRTLDRAVRWGLGWEVGLATEAVQTAGAGEEAVRRASSRTFGHLGRGGQVAWADLDRRLAFAFHTTGSLRVDEYRDWLRELQALAIRACRDG